MKIFGLTDTVVNFYLRGKGLPPHLFWGLTKKHFGNPRTRTANPRSNKSGVAHKIFGKNYTPMPATIAE